MIHLSEESCIAVNGPFQRFPLQMTTDVDDDYSDLGDLDDLDGDSDTNIDDALEAEIAAELREG